jgi:hypothetical protein
MVYNKAFIKNNIYIDFRGAKLVPLNLDIVILKLNIQLYTEVPFKSLHRPLLGGLMGSSCLKV